MSKFRFMALQELAGHKPLEVRETAGEMPDYYGCRVFNRKNMLRYLPLRTVEAIDSAIDNGGAISQEEADLVANGMLAWAKDNSVTHYTHWFQPLTDGTAEKHDSFIEFAKDGVPIERFRVRFWCNRSLMRVLFRAEDCGIRSRHGVIRLGIFRLRLSSWRIRCAFRPFSYPIQEKHWITKPLF